MAALFTSNIDQEENWKCGLDGENIHFSGCPLEENRILQYCYFLTCNTMELQTWNCRKRISPDTDKPGALHISVVLCNLESTLSRIDSSPLSKTQVPGNV